MHSRQRDRERCGGQNPEIAIESPGRAWCGENVKMGMGHGPWASLLGIFIIGTWYGIVISVIPVIS